MDKYVMIKRVCSYGEFYLHPFFRDKIPTVSELNRNDILHVFEIVSEKAAKNYDFDKGVFKKNVFKNLKVCVGAKPNVNPVEDFSLCVDDTTGKFILLTCFHTYELGNEVQPIIRKPSTSEKKQKQAKDTKNVFNSLVKGSFEAILKKYGATINPYRFEDSKGNKRNYIALDIDFNKLRKIIEAEISTVFDKPIELVEGATSLYENEFAQVDVTQFFKENNN